MSRNWFLVIFSILSLTATGITAAAQQNPSIHVVVNMVQLNVAVTDKNGNYVTGLKPDDFSILEDGIREKPATFAEGNQPARSLNDSGQPNAPTSPSNDVGDQIAGDTPETLESLVNGALVYILFDTSNYMYHGFVFAQDAISDFIRSLQRADKIAFYSYSRDLNRSSLLTADRSQVLRAVRSTVAGDEAALYNALLLTLKDAAKNKGRKVVVVFSNGPDNSSVVPPEDVAEFAQDAGVSVYMISTQSAKLEPVSTVVFERMTAATGGKAYFAKDWKDEQQAFASIRDDLDHLYSLSYYPKPNANEGWRAITVEVLGDRYKKCKVRTRKGYRPRPSRFLNDNSTTASSLTPQ